MESYTPPAVDVAPIPHLLLYVNFQSLSFWTACDIPSIEVDTKEQAARHYQPNIYIYICTHDKLEIQYSRHREKPRKNMTQATTTTVY